MNTDINSEAAWRFLIVRLTFIELLKASRLICTSCDWLSCYLSMPHSLPFPASEFSLRRQARLRVSSRWRSRWAASSGERTSLPTSRTFQKRPPSAVVSSLYCVSYIVCNASKAWLGASRYEESTVQGSLKQ